MTLFDLHEALAWFIVIANAVVGAWAVAAQYVERLRSPVLWWAVLVAEVPAFVIAVVGVVMMNRYDLELDQFHALYGFSIIVAIGILFSYRGSPFVTDKVHLLYGVGSLFIMGLGLRAMYLGTEALAR